MHVLVGNCREEEGLVVLTEAGGLGSYKENIFNQSFHSFNMNLKVG